jgi:hypothetical protein
MKYAASGLNNAKKFYNIGLSFNYIKHTYVQPYQNKRYVIFCMHTTTQCFKKTLAYFITPVIYARKMFMKLTAAFLP